MYLSMCYILAAVIQVSCADPDLAAEIDQLKATFGASIERHENDIGMLQKQVGELSEENRSLRKRAELVENIVSFTAVPNVTRTYAIDDVILFDKVLREYGTGYNPELSVFQCRLGGYYMFFLNIFSSSPRLRAEIYIDNEQELVMADTVNSNTYNSASNFGVAYCPTQGLVWVRANSPGELISDQNRASFTATLLLADSIAP